MPRKKYDSRKVNIVGNFFEDITGAMLTAERAPVDEGDFHIWPQGIGVEVKGSDANHEWRLPLHQLETYERISGGFPLDRFFFFLFCYQNPYLKVNGSGRITSLSQFDDVLDVRRFIASNLNTLYVIDIATVWHMFSLCRVSDKSIPLHPGVQSLNIRPSHLRLLADGGWKSMSIKTRGVERRSLSGEFTLAPDMLESHRIRVGIEMIGLSKGLDRMVGSFKPGILT